MTSIYLLKEQSKYLSSLIRELDRLPSIENKIQHLENEEIVKDFLNENEPLYARYRALSPSEKFAVCSASVINQGPILFREPSKISDKNHLFQQLLEDLIVVDKFYNEIGGIIGYHLKIIDLICEKETPRESSDTQKFFHPEGTRLYNNPKAVNEAVFEGIKQLPQMGEVYPIGGAGDRLNLCDEKTGLPLPTAKLMFLGRSLLTGLIRDLQAREYLYYKFYGEQITTPIALMTSEAKNNILFAEKICDSNTWFNRSKESFFIFLQPLSPVLTDQGHWSMLEPMKLNLKPSGHGVLWKVAEEKGVFKWFKSNDKKKILIRQINNPVAGTDMGLLALIGIGCKNHKAFGFASCERIINSSEGVNILREKVEDGKYQYSISNIEYTDFKKHGIVDSPQNPNSPYSIYPSNTNILFADLEEVGKALDVMSIPGMLINMKAEVPFINHKGEKSTLKGGRLESTMQNIADYITDSFPKALDPKKIDHLKTFLTYNIRRKTISVTKKNHHIGKPINETPEGCYYDYMQNNYELLLDYCDFKLPDLVSQDEYIERGPSFHFIFHPSLGPLFSIIGQKIRKGQLHEGSELQLEIATVNIEDLNLKGSLLINSHACMGRIDESDLLKYNDYSAKCTLLNVEIQNKGIDRSADNIFWKNQIIRDEKVSIYLGENSEFYAKDISIYGDFSISVPDNTKVVATMKDNKIHLESQTLTKPTWIWDYQFQEDKTIHLEKKNFES